MRIRSSAFVAVGVWAVCGCEKASDPGHYERPTTSAADQDRVTADPAPPVLQPKPAEPKPAISMTRPDPIERARGPVRAGEMPVPPSDEPAAYRAWLRGLSPAEQHRVAKFCRQHPLDYQLTCGGVGPLHIPYAPRIRLAVRRRDGSSHPTSRFEDMASWFAALTSQQTQYVETHCAGEDSPSSDLCGDNTPLVVAFEGEAVSYTSGGTFSFVPGRPVASDWPTATTPWLAMDRDNDGMITTGAELFGSSSVLPDGATAINGFAALAALDANHDGKIDATDPAFTSLLLWSDRDADRHSSPDELSPASSVLVSISLYDHLDVRCDMRRNCEGERATLQWREPSGALRTGAIIDVYLPTR